MNAPMASDTPSSSATPGDQDGQADEAHGEQLVVGRVDEPPDEPRAPAGHGAEDDRKAKATANWSGRLAGAVGVAEDGLEQGQVEGEEDVLDDDDAEDQPGLGVGQPAQLDEQLGDDGRRRDADGAGDHEGLPVPQPRARPSRQARRRR